MKGAAPDPGRIVDLSIGYWKSSILATAITHSVFLHLDDRPASPEELAERAGISKRGARAILDGLVGLELVLVENGTYANTPEASAFLVESKSTYIGPFVTVHHSMSHSWEKLPDAVATGEAPESHDAIEENPFWEELVLSIATLARPLARMAGERLGLAKAGASSILDIGGGSGVYSAEWLTMNPKAHATQIDWANINRIARDFVGKAGVGDRFRTVDGDFHTADFGASAHDLVVYSNIAHQESPKRNVEIFRRIHKALKPGGTLVVSDFVLENDRTGPAFALFFHVNMLLHTRAGAAWRETDYRAWLSEAGFKDVSVQRTPMPGTLIYAR